MPSSSETTLGQRYQLGQSLLILIRSLPTYAPRELALTPDALANLLTQIDAANQRVVTSQTALAKARDSRRQGFEGERGLIKTAARIRDYLGSLSVGKRGVAFKTVQKLCQKMTNYRTPKGTSKPSISQSELSFGSLLQSGKSLHTLILTLPDYAPSVPDLTVARVGELIAQLEAFNLAVTAAKLENDTDTLERQELYDGSQGLRDRIRRIKSGLAATYGKTSPEYLQALGLS